MFSVAVRLSTWTVTLCRMILAAEFFGSVSRMDLFSVTAATLARHRSAHHSRRRQDRHPAKVRFPVQVEVRGLGRGPVNRALQDRTLATLVQVSRLEEVTLVREYDRSSTFCVTPVRLRRVRERGRSSLCYVIPGRNRRVVDRGQFLARVDRRILGRACRCPIVLRVSRAPALV